jgi:hypothetical protein
MADLSPADTWTYWRDKKGYLAALEEQYADTIKQRPDIAACIYNIKVAQAYIDGQMDQLAAGQGEVPPEQQKRDTRTMWAREMTDDELKAAWLAISKDVDEWEAAPAEDKECGGSPGEGLYERYGELEGEMKRRGFPLAAPDQNASPAEAGRR